MASSRCLFWTCCDHVNLQQGHVNPTSKLYIHKTFKSKTNSTLHAISRTRSERYKQKAKANESQARDEERKIRILIAGGGIGGLVLGLAAKLSGFEVMVFEKDLSAVRGEGRHRGPIQLLSNALGILEGIDKDVVEEITNSGCVTGNRLNGLADGFSGKWLVTYDQMTPACERGLPVSLVISRMRLQEILVNAIGSDVVFNNCKVVDFSQDPHKVMVTLNDGRQFEGDVLVGADGIWSELNKELFNVIDALIASFREGGSIVELSSSSTIN